MKRKIKNGISVPRVFERPALAWLFVLFIGLCFYFLIRWAGWPPAGPRPEPKPSTRPAGLIAVIIDDNGYSDESCPQIRSIPQPIAVSILPDLPYSRTIADCAHDARKEIMLHLPMEPHVWHETYADDYVITTDMSPARIRQVIDTALQGVPYVQGMNNHMGSKATEDQALMTVVLHEMKRRNLFFIDSRVTLKSVVPSLAKRIGLPCAERKVFLDNEADRDYITGQFEELAERARREGWAIGIGHARPLTWAVTRDQFALLEKQGFRIISVTELLKHLSHR